MTHLEKIQAAREAYQPEAIDYLIIAEAPPSNPNRFFYFEDVKTHDSLFLHVMEVLFPEIKKSYLKKGRPTQLKIELLERFKEHGFFLLDLSDQPCELNTEPLAALVPGLVERVHRLAHRDTWIIMIKANVYDLAYKALIDAGISGVIDVRIPFPGSGQQTRFKLAFRHALEEAGYAVLY
jgi:hypothetical protein